MKQINLKLATIVSILAVFLTALVSGQAYNNDQYGMGSGMMGMMNMMTGYGGYGSGMMLLGWLTYLLIIALIIAAIYWLIKTANRKR